MALAGRARRRCAATLIEFVVAAAAIAVLLSLLAPALVTIRAHAQKSHCANNLRQLGCAVHNYYTSEKRIPYNTFSGQYGGGRESTAWSWLARLMPHLDQQAMHKSGSIPFTTLRQSGVANKAIAGLLCPSDPTCWDGPRYDAGNLAGFPVGLTSYKGVSGANWGDDGEGDAGISFRTDWRNAGANGSHDGHSNGDGIFFRVDYRRRLRFEHILDGASNTLLIGEDVCRATLWCSWPYSNNAIGTCAIPPNVKKRNGGNYSPGNWQNNQSFRSAHAGGLHFALADGSVRFLTNNVSLSTYRALATISGGERLELP